MLALLATAALAAPAPHWTVTVDPLTTALGFVHVQVERTVGEHASVYVGPSLKLFEGLLPYTDGPFHGTGVEAGVRGFLWGTAPRGGWVMVRGVLADVRGEPTGAPPEPGGLGGYTSALFGATAILGPGLVLSGGVGISWFDYGSSAGNPDWGIHGPLPAAHTNVGWAF